MARNLTPVTIGRFAYIRFLKNNGVTFDTAHFLTVGTMPRKPLVNAVLHAPVARSLTEQMDHITALLESLA
jgi:hypothetical protein